ncbi:hypothetical protein D3C78_1217300 [compost metagenome]
MGELLEQRLLLREHLVAEALETLDYVPQGLFSTLTALLVMLIAHAANLGHLRNFLVMPPIIHGLSAFEFLQDSRYSLPSHTLK